MNGSLVLASIVFALLVIEALLRIVDYNYDLGSAYDPYTGYGFRANLEGWVKTESTERVRTDQFALRTYGYSDDPRNYDRTLKKPENTFRIAVLGDSFTQSMHVDYTESFPYRLQESLNTCSAISKTVEVLNFGISGFSNVQELLSYRHRARNFEPDIVLLVFHSANDLRNNYRKLERFPFAPYGEFRNGELHLDLSFQSDPAFHSKLMWSNTRNTLANNSYLLKSAIRIIGSYRHQQWHSGRVKTWDEMRLADRKAKEEKNYIPAEQELPLKISDNKGYLSDNKGYLEETGRELDKYFDPAYVPPGINFAPEYFPPKNAFVEMLWKLSESVILQLNEDVHRSGGRLWLTSTATGIAITPDPLARQNLDEPPDYANRRLQGFAEKHDIPFVSLLSPLQKYAISTGENLQQFKNRKQNNGHYNRAAHRVIGKTLGDAICERFSG